MTNEIRPDANRGGERATGTGPRVLHRCRRLALQLRDQGRLRPVRSLAHPASGRRVTPGAEAVSAIRFMLVALGLCAAMTAAAQSPSRESEPAGRVAELEAQVAQLMQQLELLRANRTPEVRWLAPPLGPQEPPSPLQRTSAVATVEAGCPPGAVCLVVRCDAPHWR